MRQTYSFSCGIACLIAVRDLMEYGKLMPHSSKDESSILNKISISSSYGLGNAELIDFIKTSSDFSSFLNDYGEDTYRGGVAIANIRNFRSGIGHFVVFLGIKNDVVQFYDPIDGLVHKMTLTEFEWVNSSGDILKWSANFNIKNFTYDLKSVEKKAFIIKGSADPFNPIYDTASFLYDEYHKSNKSVSLVNDKQIVIIDSILYLDGMAVRENDDIWIKIDPRQSEDYFLILRVLSLFEDKVNFFNPPSKILLWDDKLISTTIKNYTLVTEKKSLNEVNYFYNGMSLVVKRLNGFGGRDVHFLSEMKKNEQPPLSNSPYIIEKDISRPSGDNEDIRILWFNGSFVGSVIRYSNGSKYCNMTQGGAHKSFLIEDILKSLDDDLLKELNVISDFLTKNNFKIAGVDVLNNSTITEVNVSNVSVFKNFIEDTGINFIKEWIS